MIACLSCPSPLQRHNYSISRLMQRPPSGALPSVMTSVVNDTDISKTNFPIGVGNLGCCWCLDSKFGYLVIFCSVFWYHYRYMEIIRKEGRCNKDAACRFAGRIASLSKPFRLMTIWQDHRIYLYVCMCIRPFLTYHWQFWLIGAWVLE